MTNSADPDQLASEEAIWSGSSLFAKAGHYPGSAGLGFTADQDICHCKQCTWYFEHIWVQNSEISLYMPCSVSCRSLQVCSCLRIIKGLNSPVMTDSMRNLYIPENHFAFHLNLCEASPSKRKKTKWATAKNKGADQSARMRRLICAFVVRTCIKASFLSSSYEDEPCIKHKSHYFLLISQWRTNIHTWSTFLHR